MQSNRVDKWAWALVYGGLLGATLGWFLRPGSEAAAWTLMAGGGVAAAVGVVLIYVRSRMGP